MANLDEACRGQNWLFQFSSFWDTFLMDLYLLKMTIPNLPSIQFSCQNWLRYWGSKFDHLGFFELRLCDQYRWCRAAIYIDRSARMSSIQRFIQISYAPKTDWAISVFMLKPTLVFYGFLRNRPCLFKSKVEVNPPLSFYEPTLVFSEPALVF